MVGANSPKPLISLRHVGFSYGKPGASFWGRRAEHSAIRDISFDVYPGETVGIIGGNGAGKTTLLKLIAGVLKPAVGTITRADVRISMLSLQVGFLPHLTGRENAILGGLLLGLSKEQAKKNLALIEEFVSRDGTDFTDLDQKIQNVKAQLNEGTIVIVFDEESETCNIVRKETLKMVGDLADE